MNPDRENDNSGWATEMKAIMGSLIDLAVRMLETNNTKLGLNEVLTTEEISSRLKSPFPPSRNWPAKAKSPERFVLDDIGALISMFSAAVYQSKIPSVDRARFDVYHLAP